MNKLHSEDKQRKGKASLSLSPFNTTQEKTKKKKKKSLLVKSVSPINYFIEKELKDAIFLCTICTILMIVEVTHMTWGGKYNIKINQFSWKWEFFH